MDISFQRMEVVRDDFTFAMLENQPLAVFSDSFPVLLFGMAFDCGTGTDLRCDPIGTFGIDTTDTGVIVDPAVSLSLHWWLFTPVFYSYLSM
jgi:hypothetical protein